MKKVFILLVLVFGVAIHVQAQQKKDVYIINLKNGSALIGVLEHYALDQPAIIRMGDGEKLTVPYSSIDSMEKIKGKLKKPRVESANAPYSFKEKGWHFFGNVGLISSGGSSTNPGLGFTLDAGATYHFNRLFGLGIKTGIDSYNSSIKQDFIPIYVSIDGYLSPKKASVFYSLGLGYGISIKSEEIFGNGGPDTKGGLFLYPKIGVRLNGIEGVNMTLFGGVKVQDSEFEYQICGFDSCDEFIRQERTFQRIVFGVGFVF